MTDKEITPEALAQLVADAENDNPFALNTLGEYYAAHDTQQQAHRDLAQAESYFLRAANQGFAPAMKNLGDFYHHHEDWYDWEKSSQWYEKAAELHHVEAMYRVGLRYSWYDNDDEDADEKAYAWFIKAASLGHPESMAELVKLCEYERVAGKTIEEAQEWDFRRSYIYKNRSDAGCVDATKELAWIYRYGNLIVEPDIAAAIAHYKIAYYQGFEEATMHIAELYRTGEMGDDACDNAIDWYEQAIDDGNLKALFSLGEMYHLGDGIPEDKAQAAAWFKKALGEYEKRADNDTDFLFRLGYMYAHGYGTNQNDERALFYFSKGAKLDDPDCTHWLANFYEDGRGGLAINEQLAAELHEKADELY